MNNRLLPVSLSILLGFGIFLLALGLFLHSIATPPLEARGEDLTVVQVPLVQASAESTVASSTSILFVGDMFFDREIRFVQGERGADYPFSCVDSLLSSTDAVVGNLEGPITANPSVSFGTIPGSPNNYRFTFPTTTAETLARHHVAAVTIGNNHILNFGYDGLAATKLFLDRAGVGYFGGVNGDEAVYRTMLNGISFSFIGYNQFGGSAPRAVAAVIKQEKDTGRVVVVYAHWGTEYSTDAGALQQIAGLFAQSGASLIIGSHPHVVGKHEWIGSTLVYYSLGNFIFDQYFSFAVQHGLALKVTFASPTNPIIAVSEYPTEMERDGSTCPVQ